MPNNTLDTVPIGINRKRRPGLARVITHIILFAIIGIIALSFGVYGLKKLELKTIDQKAIVRIETLFESSIKEMQSRVKDIDKEHASDIKIGIDSRKRKLKESITAMVRQGEENHAIAMMAMSTLEEGILNRIKDEKIRQNITETITLENSSISEEIEELVTIAVERMNPAQTRLALMVTEPNYGLMYYHMPLIAAGSFFLLFSAALLFVWLRYDDRKRARVGELLEPIDYLLPFFLGVAIFTFYPIVRVFIMSFQERYKLEGSFSGWGFGNYSYVIKGIPGTTNYFLQGLSNTLQYVLYTVPISTALAIIIAYLLNQKLRFSALFQTAYFLPMVTSITAVGLVWRWIFNRDFGVLNALISWLGGDKINWLQQASHSLTVLIIFGIWSALPFTIILLLSGLQNIDESFYTVAKVDGASQFRIFRRITIPLLSPTIGLVLIINSISAFKVFTEVNVLFNGNPGPVHNLYTVVYYIYDMLRQQNELGRAAAAAIILFLFILVFTVLQRFIQRKWKYD